MSDDRLLDALAPEFRVERVAHSIWAVRRDVESLLQQTGFTARSDGGLQASELVGRKPLFELAVGTDRFVVRKFSHGGLWRFATGRRFSDPLRPFREIASARHLTKHGLKTAEIVAARARRSVAFGWELDLVTRRVEGAVDLGLLLGRARRGAVDHHVVARCCAALGDFVRRMHACGFLHADLTPNNVLVNASVSNGAEPALVVLDLDRARIVERLSEENRLDNLRRLYRFIARREERDGRALTRTDYARFFAGYDAGGERWKSDWRSVASAHARSHASHAIGWRLEEWLGKKRDVREK